MEFLLKEINMFFLSCLILVIIEYCECNYVYLILVFLGNDIRLL